MHIKLINEFTDKDFQELFKKYFKELKIEVSDYDKLFKQMNDRNNTHAFLTYEDDKAIGFIMFSIESFNHWFLSESFGFIQEFWIDPQYRCHHVGSSLLQKVEDYFLNNDVYKVLLTTDTAEVFYFKHGYSFESSLKAKNQDPVFTKTLEKLVIKETEEGDLDNILSLWNDGRVMHFVGFPDGLNTDYEAILSWHQRLSNIKESAKHYSIYLNNRYCGETFYSTDQLGYASLDIKLLPFCRGQNIAYRTLSFAIDEAFRQSSATVVYVDPHPDHKKAWQLYQRLGFKEVIKPKHLEVSDTYQEINKEDWINNKGER